MLCFDSNVLLWIHFWGQEYWIYVSCYYAFLSLTIVGIKERNATWWFSAPNALSQNMFCLCCETFLQAVFAYFMSTHDWHDQYTLLHPEPLPTKIMAFGGQRFQSPSSFPSTFFCLPPQLQDEDEEWRGIFMAPAMLIRESKISHATADPLVMHQDENK